MINSIELLKKLIRIDSSIPGNSNRAIEVCSAYLRKNGVLGEIIDNKGYKSYVATIGKGRKTLVLNGHLDVVSGKEDQFDPFEDNGKIFGRGSADMKGGCVAMIQALIKLKDRNLNNRIMLQLVPDEETGGKNGTRYLVEQGYIGDFVICTEPTNLKISIQSKGIVRIDIESRGIAAHGSRPWEGENAILKAFRNFSKIEKLPIMNVKSDFYESSTVNLAKINGGDIYNRIPDSCIMGLDIRYIPDIDPQEIIDEIRMAVDGEVSVLAIEPDVNTKPDNLYIKKLKESIDRIMPEEATRLEVQHGGSDTRFFSSKGIPAVELGPRGNYWHGNDEYVESDSIYQLERVLIDFAEKF